jgi:hypothetical protein
MAKIPQIQRLVTEDFQDQKKWIGKLFQPINTFMELVVSAFDRNLTLTENVAADILYPVFTSVPTATAPLSLAWRLKVAPIALVVADVQSTVGTSFTISAAVQVQWTYTDNSGLQITNLVGLTPTNNDQYRLTILALTG